MNIIKFSHHYRKINGMDQANALLIEVLIVQLEDLSKRFLDWDTDNGLYALPKKGKYLLLIFDKCRQSERSLFTTLRRWTPEKELYYKNKINELFKIEIVRSSHK